MGWAATCAAVSGGFEVRLGGPDDIPEATDAWWQLVQEQNAHDDRARRTGMNEERARRFVATRIQQGRLWVARWHGRLAGICTVAPDDFFLEGGPSIWIIADVWVDPELRRRGVAKRLMASAEAMAWQSGADEVRLTVHEGNQAALELYARSGYHSIMRTLRRRRP